MHEVLVIHLYLIQAQFILYFLSQLCVGTD